MMGLWIFAALLALVVIVALGALWGFLYRVIWGAVHGADRTPQAARSMVLVALAVQLATWLVVLLVEPAAELAGLALLTIGFSLPYLAAVYAVFRSGAAAVAAAPQEPHVLAREHDGLTFEVRWKPAWISALVTALAVAVPVPLAFAAIAWSRSYRSAVVRIRNDAVAVDGETASLHGARLEDAVRGDGTPVLRVVAPDATVEIPVGGTPPAELAWVRETLATAIREAEDTRLPPQPEALRQLAARVQQ